MRLLSAILFLVLSTVLSSQAQVPPSHEALLADVTAGCLERAVQDRGAFRFLPQGATDRVASPLVASWTDGGKTVYLEPSDASAPLLVVTTDQSDITLSRIDGNTVRREARIDLTWWLSSNEGDVLATDTCRDARSDELSRADATALAVEGSPVFNPDLPPKSRMWNGVRKVAEPVVLLGATAVGTYLLFNLRSRRSDNG